MLELKNVTTEIAGTLILRDVTFSVEKGSMVGLIGRNGAGKTTSLRSIMGLLKPKSGQILINGTDMTKQGSFERAGMSIGYMPED
ncbi:ATP-binding cassette domain-containing protein, partial [Marinobacter alexandrii]